MSFMSSFLLGRFLHPGVFSLCVLLPLLASATTSHISFSYAARQRMQNRARLLKQYQTHLKKQASYIVEGNAESRKALRQHNREQIKQHPEWFPAPLKASDETLAGAGGEQPFLKQRPSTQHHRSGDSPPGAAAWQALRLGRHAARSRLRL